MVPGVYCVVSVLFLLLGHLCGFSFLLLGHLCGFSRELLFGGWVTCVVSRESCFLAVGPRVWPPWVARSFALAWMYPARAFA